MAHHPFDVAVIGAGCFGAWTAWHLARRGQRVLLLEAHAPAHGRASSGDESRILRLGYGAEEVYSRWAQRSLPQWCALGDGRLFSRTGVLFLAHHDDALAFETLATLRRLGLPHERLSRAELEERWPQVEFGSTAWGLLEPGSGVLHARRAVQAVVEDAVRLGAQYRQEAVSAPAGPGRLGALRTARGEAIAAGAFVFACGPWLPALFPSLLAGRIVPTRQEVFYFGTPAGDHRFRAPALPAWIDFTGDEVYGLPDLDGRGFKVALDRRGELFDPDRGDRQVTPQGLQAMRDFLARRFPALADAPLVETRVCQYETTSSGDFLIDRHPELGDVWLVGGGSGHGFKHGPAVGEHVAGLLGGEVAAEPRFALETKALERSRRVY